MSETRPASHDTRAATPSETRPASHETRAATPAGSRAAGLLARVEHAVKGPIWGCKMCGQCVLHDTGLTCPMTCPKTLRNGPCGGVRPDGHCEVKPEMRCVWLKAYERSEKLPLWRGHVDNLRPPVNNELKGTSSWLNLITGRDRQTPAGWAAADVQP